MAKLLKRNIPIRYIPPTPYEPVVESEVESPVQNNSVEASAADHREVQEVENSTAAMIAPENNFELPHQILDRQLKNGNWNEIVDGVIHGEYVVYPKSQIEMVFTEHEILASFLIEMIDKVASVKIMLGEDNLKFVAQKSRQLEGKSFIEIMSDITMNGSKYWEVITQLKAISTKIGQTMKFNFSDEDLLAIKGLLLRNEVNQDKFENLMKLPN